LVLLAHDPATEDSLRAALTEALNVQCVVISAATLARIAEGALAALKTAGYLCAPPYRTTVDGVECEWCVVLSSDVLPAAPAGQAWLFQPTRTVVAVTVLERRALLARKRRFNANGKRVTLGSVLKRPMETDARADHRDDG
jgi:hypothetical protein